MSIQLIASSALNIAGSATGLSDLRAGNHRAAAMKAGSGIALLTAALAISVVARQAFYYDPEECAASCLDEILDVTPIGRKGFSTPTEWLFDLCKMGWLRKEAALGACLAKCYNTVYLARGVILD